MGMRLTFERCVKAICSEWDWDRVANTMDSKNKIYETYYIKSGFGRKPTTAECLAIAEYLGWIYHKGFFYRRIK